MPRGFFVHGYDEVAEPGECDRCERTLAGRPCFHVSYTGVVATHRLCSACRSHLRQAYGEYYRGEGQRPPGA